MLAASGELASGFAVMVRQAILTVLVFANRASTFEIRFLVLNLKEIEDVFTSAYEWLLNASSFLKQ